MDDRRIRRVIPENYATGLNIRGYNFRVRNFIEGIVLGVVFGAVLMAIVWNFTFLDSGTKFGFILSAVAGGFILGTSGINDEPITEFISNAFKFRGKRRNTYYNKRVKLEVLPYVYEQKNRMENMPIEKIKAYFIKVKERSEQAERNAMVEFQKTNTFDSSSMYFKDDKGFIDTPYEYMNASERRKYKAELRKKARLEKKEAKKLLKEQKKALKLAEKEAKIRHKEELKALKKANKQASGR